MAGDRDTSTDGLFSVLQGEEVQVPYKKTLPQIFDRLMEDRKGVRERTALSFGGIRVIFEQLQQRSEQLARKLCQRLENDIGLGRMKSTRNDHVIAIHVPPGDHLVVTLFAVLRTGAAYCPLEPDFPASRISYILGDAKPLCVLTLGINKKSLNEAIKDHPNIPVYDVKELADRKLGKSDMEVASESRTIGYGDLQFVLYTSGSTGVPKGVKLLLSSVLNRLFWQWKTFPYGETEVGSFKTSLTFVDHVSEIFGPLLQGIPLCIVPKQTVKDPVAFINYLEAHQVTRLVMVPSLLQMILAFLEGEGRHVPNKIRLQDVKMWVCSGETLPESLLRKFFEYYSKPGFEHQVIFCNFYGATEDMGDVTYSCFRSISDVDDTVQDNNVPIGTPVFNTRGYLLNDDLSVVELGQIGQLYVAGACLAQGYIGNHANDESAFIRNPYRTSNCDSVPKYDVLYRTGDFAKIHNGTLIFQGRYDAQVKVRGQKVNMSEIERVAEAMSALEKPVVICCNQGKPTQEIVLFYTGKEKMNETEIRAEFKNHLTDFMVPKIFHVKNYPFLANSKIDRHGLIAIYKNQGGQEIITSIARNEVTVEKDKESKAPIILKAIADTLQIPHHIATLTANFFEIGGNSVLAALLKAKLRKMDIDLDIADIIDSVTLVDIVNAVNPLGVEKRSFTDVCELKDHGYRLVPLHQYDHPDALIHMTADTYTSKELLCRSSNVSKSSVIKFLRGYLAPSIKEELSFVLLDDDERLLGMYANLDICTSDSLDVEIADAQAMAIGELLDSMLRDVKKILHGKGKFMDNVLGTTDLTLNYKENLIVSLALEKQTVLIAKCRGFQGVIVTNTSPVTQELCENLGYRTVKILKLKDFQTEDGSLPFSHVSDHLIIKAQLIVLDPNLDLENDITFLD